MRYVAVPVYVAGRAAEPADHVEIRRIGRDHHDGCAARRDVFEAGSREKQTD